MTSKTTPKLAKLIEICTKPSINDNDYIEGRIMSPKIEIGINLYNEIKEIYNKITFRQK